MPDLTGTALIAAFIGVVALIIAISIRFRRRIPDFVPGDEEMLEELLAENPPDTLRGVALRGAEAAAHKTQVLGVAEATAMLQEAAHIAVLGGTGDGKTTTGEALTRALLPGKFAVIDMNWVKGKWGGLNCATIDSEGGWEPIEGAMHLIDQELSRRRLAARDGEDAAGFPTLNVLWDEVNETIEELGDMAGSKLRRWLRTARQFRIRLVVFLQSDRVAALGIEGHGDARKNLIWLYVGGEARRLAVAEVRAKREYPEFMTAVLNLKYPGVIKWHERLYAVDMSGFVQLAGEVRAVARGARVAWSPKEAPQGDDPPAPGPPAVAGIDDVGVFTLLARLVDSDKIQLSETAALEVGFRCGAGAGKVYQTALSRLRAARAVDQASVPGSEEVSPT